MSKMQAPGAAKARGQHLSLVPLSRLPLRTVSGRKRDSEKVTMITAVMIDSREPDWVQALQFGGAPRMVVQLDAGDVQAVTDDGYTLLFERKTLTDFLGSIADERIFVQCAKMTELRNAQLREGSQVTQYCYVVITDPITCNHEGKVIDPGRGVTGWSYSAVQGAILSIQEMGVHVVWAHGDKDFEETILRIGKRNRSPETLIAAPRPARFLGPKIDLLTGFPGIGPDKAQVILDWSNHNLAHALTGLTDLEIESPIGFALRKRIRDLLGLQETENLEIIGTQLAEPIAVGEK